MSVQWCERRSLVAGVLALAAVFAGDGVVAGSGRLWQASTAGSLGRGTLDGTALDERGRLRLSPTIETWWGPEEGIVWDVASDGDDAVFVATSGPPRVLRVTDSDAAVWFQAEGDALVTAVVADGRGGVWVGLSAPGRILNLTAPETIGIEFATESSFVWDLARDDEGFWAATGLPGSVLRNPGGDTWEHVWESGDDPVRTIHVGDGFALAGTGGRGRVVRFDGDDRPFVVFDADEPEIVGLAALPDGTLFVLAAKGAPRVNNGGDAPPPSTATERVRVTAEPPATPPARPAPARTAPPRSAPSGPRLEAAAGGALYRIAPDGATRRVWNTARSVPYAMVRGSDRLFVATGESGHVVAFDPEGRAARLLRIPSSQASAIDLAADGTLLVGATTDARVVRVGNEERRRGTWDSPPIDATAPARWGRVRWEGDGPVTGRARVGNTDEPDETWTDWRDLQRRGDTWVVPEELPRGRWLQVQLQLGRARAASAIVSAVEVAYRPTNRPPAVESLTVHPEGVAWIRASSQAASAGGPWASSDPVARRRAQLVQGNRSGNGSIRRYFEPGVITMAWSVADPDGDRLTYDLDVRREGTADWIGIARDLRDTFHTWDARAVPDGRYRVRLTARDTLDNDPDDRAADERVSDLFDVDRTRPRVADWRVRPDDGDGARVSFTVEDPGGAIAAVEFAVDGGPWQPVQPVDGVADSAEERYELELGQGEVPSSMQLRVTDRSGNVGGELRGLSRD